MEQAALNHINIALWILVVFTCLGSVAFIAFVCFTVKLIKQFTETLNEVKEQTKIIVDKIDPIIVKATDTLEELKSTSVRINALSKRLTDNINSIGNFISYFGFMRGFLPGSNKLGFFSGLLSGFNILKSIKQNKNNKKNK